MAITVPAYGDFSTVQGPSRIEAETKSILTIPTAYNVYIPTGSANRNYIKGGASVTVINPDGNGKCLPLTLAAFSVKYLLINVSGTDTDLQFVKADFSKFTNLLEAAFAASEVTLPAARANSSTALATT